MQVGSRRKGLVVVQAAGAAEALWARGSRRGGRSGRSPGGAVRALPPPPAALTPRVGETHGRRTPYR